MSLAIDRISIAGFKSIKQLDDLNLRQINVFVGSNGAGKSNFIQIFTLIENLLDERLQDYVKRSGGADNLLYFGRKQTDRLAIEFWFPISLKMDNGYRAELSPTDENGLYFRGESCYIWDKKQYQSPYEQILGFEHDETRIHEKTDKPSIERHVFKRMSGWQVFHFNDTGMTSRVRGTADITDDERLRPDGSNLAAVLYRIRENSRECYRNIMDAMRLVAPFFGDLELRPSVHNEDMIRLRWRHRESDQSFDVSSMSDGTLRFLCLATLLLQPKIPTLLILDEPELGLHPFAISALSEMIRSASQKSQVLVSTQSVTLVDQFGPDDIVVVDRPGNESVFRRPSTEELSEWINDFSMGELWQKNLIGGRP